jgi:hypothetical protein
MYEFCFYACIFVPEATKQIADIANHINEHMRQHKNFQKMLAIQKTFDNSAPKILQPGRVFIKEGPLKKVGTIYFLSFFFNYYYYFCFFH